MTEDPSVQRLKAILSQVQSLGGEYYQLTGKPLGVTGEVAEYVAAELLGLELAPARTEGYDAIRKTDGRDVRIQIKGRAFSATSKPGQRIGRIKRGAPCDLFMMVLLDNGTLVPREIWEAPAEAVMARLDVPGGKARTERGTLGVNEFKRLATCIWPQGGTAKAKKDVALRSPGQLSQSDMVRRLLEQHGYDKTAVVAAYAQAEIDRLVARKSNKKGLSAEEYAEALWKNGHRKDKPWILDYCRSRRIAM